MRTFPLARGEGWAVDKARKKTVAKSAVSAERRRQRGQHKKPKCRMDPGKVSAITGCCVGLTPPETTNTEFFKYLEATSQAALKKNPQHNSLSRFT